MDEVDRINVYWAAMEARRRAIEDLTVFVLKKRFSGLVAIQAEHKLETRGIYGLVRNPSYLGMLVSASKPGGDPCFPISWPPSSS